MRKAGKSLNRLLSRSKALGLCLCFSASLCGQAFAQAEGAGPSGADLEKLETKMFSRHYPNDPPEKRVERLELLVFGATQGGSLDERWEHISKVIKDRQNPESTMAQPKTGDSSSSSGVTSNSAASAAPGKGNYPAVDSLEWRVLKKTYRSEPIGDRLSRLETKLLGQANPGMALFDRVERLKKIGASVAAGSQPPNSGAATLPPSILGPMPKAYPRGSMPFSFDSDGGQMTPSPFSIQPFGGDDFSSINRMMSEMMTQMNRQMRDLKNMPPGTYQYRFDPSDPNSQGLMPFRPMPAKPGKPGQPPALNKPFDSFQPVMPKKAPTIQESLPPYADPNSI